MGDRSTAGWNAADTALLVRAWGAAAIESAPKSATARAVFAHFQRLAPGGDSGRAEKAVHARRALLHNMHAVIRAHDARALSTEITSNPSPSVQSNSPSSESVPIEQQQQQQQQQQHERTWFQLAEPERRVRFAEINKRSWMQFVDVTPEQFADISALKSLSVGTSGGGGDAAPDASENEAAGSDDELSARTARWQGDDTTTLLRAWEQVASESAPKRPTVREIVQRFEQLSDGGSSGRAEVSVVQRHTILRNMHAVIHAHDTRALSEMAQVEHTAAAEAGEEEAPSAAPPQLWFSLTEDERRRCFTELNTRKWLQYAKLTEEQFATISTIKSLTAASPVAVVVPPDVTETERVGEFAMKTHRWKSDDTTLLVRAWAEVAAETAKVTAKEVAKRFETLSEGGCSGRSLTAVPQKHTVIRNMYTIICVHDERAVAEAAQTGESVPRLWFDLSRDERRRFFTEMNKKAWTHYVELTEEQYHAISTIKNSRMTEPAAPSLESIADEADIIEPSIPGEVPKALPIVRVETRLPTPRAFWSTKNTMLLLCAWAETRVAKKNPHPSPSEVTQHFQTLSKDKGGLTNENSIRQRHNMLHNMYNIICAYTESLAKTAADDDESKCEERLPWFSLVYDERRRVFTAMNTKTSCWFVDLAEDHFTFIADTLKQDVGGAAETPTLKTEGEFAADANQAKRPRGMWTSEHTTTMLRAWRDVVTEKTPSKPTTGTVYQHFLDLSNGTGGAESSFIHRFRSLRFLHSTIVAYNAQCVDEKSERYNEDGERCYGTNNDDNDTKGDDDDDNKRDGSSDSNDINDGSASNTTDKAADTIDTKVIGSNDNKSGDSNSAALINHWFELTPKERRRHFNDAGGKALLFVDITREQFDELSSILSDKSLPMPMITRRSDTREGGEGGKRKRARGGRRKSQQEESNADQTTKQRKLLPAPSATSSTSKLEVDAEERSQSASDDNDEEGEEDEEENAVVNASEQSTAVAKRVEKQKHEDNGHAHALSQTSDKLDKEAPPTPATQVSYPHHGESNAGSEPEDHGELEAQRPFCGDVIRKADSEKQQQQQQQQLKRKRGEKLRLVHDMQNDANRPPEKRMRAQARLLSVAALIKKQTEALEQMLCESREVRARDQAERETIVSCMAQDARERKEGREILHGRLEEIRRQRVTWREARDEMKRAQDNRCE